VLSVEAINTNFIVFGLIRSGLEFTIYDTRPMRLIGDGYRSTVTEYMYLKISSGFWTEQYANLS